MRAGRFQLVLTVFLVVACEVSTTTTENSNDISIITAQTAAKTERNLLTFNHISPHSTAEPLLRDETTTTEEERMVGMAGAAAGANRGGGTTVATSEDNGPSSWEKFKLWWNGLWQ